MEASKKSWKDQWVVFFHIIFNPFTIISLFLTLGLGYALNSQTDENLILLITALLSISAGVTGGVIRKRWEEHFEEKVLAARGKLAIRNLTHILYGIGVLQNRIQEFLERTDEVDKRLSKNVIKCNMEELVGSAQFLKVQVTSSIENWQDVLPEKDQVMIEILSGFRRERDDLLMNLYKLKEDEEAGKEDYNEIIERLEELEDSISDKAREYGYKFVSGSSGAYPTISGSDVILRYNQIEGFQLVDPKTKFTRFSSSGDD